MIKGVEAVPDELAAELQPETQAPTLRETVAAAFEEHLPETSPEAPELKAEGGEKPAGERLRDEHGKFVKTEGKLPEKIPAVKSQTEQAQAPTVVEKNAPPSSWKKEHHERWTGIDPETQKYILQRESEFAKGVSTYKGEYEQLKPLGEAVAPFLEDLRANNINPAQWVYSLGSAHYLLVKGTPEQKLSMFMKLANDYQVPLQQLFAKGEDGKVYFNPQVPSYAPPQPDINQLVESKMAEYFSRQNIRQFGSELDATGNPKHPHYDTVRETMAQLLESGLADDLESAYATALRHPRHAELYDSLQATQRETEEKARQEKIRQEAQRARSSAVSVKGKTPVAQSTPASKGVRGAIEAAFDEVQTGRI